MRITVPHCRFHCEQNIVRILQLKKIGGMGGKDDLTHYVPRIEWTIDIHGQISNQHRHGRQPLGVNTILRFLDANQPVDFRILGQNRERKKTQRAVRYCARRKFLASGFDDREGEQLARVVENHIDAGYGDQLRESRGYSRGNVAIGTFQFLQPVESRSEVSAIVRNDDRVPGNSVRPAHGTRFQREQPPLLHLPARRKNRRGGYRARCAHDRSGCGLRRRPLSGTS